MHFMVLACGHFGTLVNDGAGVGFLVEGLIDGSTLV